MGTIISIKEDCSDLTLSSYTEKTEVTVETGETLSQCGLPARNDTQMPSAQRLRCGCRGIRPKLST